MKKFRDMMDYNKRSNIHVMRVPKEEDKECRAENAIKKITVERFSNVWKGKNKKQTKRGYKFMSEQNPNWINSNKSMPIQNYN